MITWDSSGIEVTLLINSAVFVLFFIHVPNKSKYPGSQSCVSTQECRTIGNGRLSHKNDWKSPF